MWMCGTSILQTQSSPISNYGNTWDCLSMNVALRDTQRCGSTLFNTKQITYLQIQFFALQMQPLARFPKVVLYSRKRGLSSKITTSTRNACSWCAHSVTVPDTGGIHFHCDAHSGLTHPSSRCLTHPHGLLIKLQCHWGGGMASVQMTNA